MTIEVLLPHMSCVCRPSELDEALAQGYKEVYIVSTKGIIKHHQLRGDGRYVRLAVKDIPGYKEPAITPEMNFLPGGKIPYILYQQVEAFFRQVIQMKGTALEAMIFVLWNKTDGYFLHVPTQTVAAAAVTFDPTSIPSGSTVVVNIHSHGTMNAFFSGTDDNNDKDLIQFSGVFGQFQNAIPQTTWRFNYYTTKFKAEVSDMFEVPGQPQVEIPADWISKVEQRTYTTSLYKGGGVSNQGNVHSGQPFSHLNPSQFPQSGRGRGNLSVVERNPRGTSDGINTHKETQQEFFNHAPEGDALGRQVPVDPTARPVWRAGPSGVLTRDVTSTNDLILPGIEGEDETGFSSNEAFVQAMYRSDLEDASIETGDGFGEAGESHLGKSDRGAYLRAQERLSRQNSRKQWDGFPVSTTSLPSTDPEDAQYQQDRELDAEFVAMQADLAVEGGVPGRMNGMYELVHAQHGTDVADTWHDISNTMYVLQGKDDLITELVTDMFNLMGEEGQLKLFRELFQHLSGRSQTMISTNGI